MARRRQKAFVPRQKPKESVREVKRVETTIASIEKQFADDENMAEVKMSFTNGGRYTANESNTGDTIFKEILYLAEVGDSIILVTHASKIIAVEYYC